MARVCWNSYHASTFILLRQDKPYIGWVVFMCDITLLRTSTYPSRSDTRCLIAHRMQVHLLLLRSPQQYLYSHTPSISIRYFRYPGTPNTQKVHWQSPENLQNSGKCDVEVIDWLAVIVRICLLLSCAGYTWQVASVSTRPSLPSVPPRPKCAPS